ncbi:MAG: 3-dehydroquinate synthase [Nitrososphaerota archaeon]|nr:3-dehydroquinate synthase [Nitrososphaerota archaeon]
MGTARVRIALPPGGEGGYDIVIREGVLCDMAEGTSLLTGATSIFIVTDSNVARIYASRVRGELSKMGKRVRVVAIPAGESNKNIRTAWALASRLSGLGADRGSVLLALGGGVVGDLAGFVASIYKRGVDYIQLPTTLLAQVDSSIGGKTGVDAPWGKNQVGTFHQPRGVLTDPLALKTLPRTEMLNGLAEIIKCSVVADRKMFDKVSSLTDPGSTVPMDLIVRACQIKAGIVSKDPRETNLRTVLNYGHTVGHALESASDYRQSHGSCVVFGMLAEGWIASSLGILQKSDFERLEGFLIPFSKGIDRPNALDKAKLFNFTLADKKSSASKVRMSLPGEIGKMYITEDGSYRVPVSKETFEGSVDYLHDVLASFGAQGTGVQHRGPRQSHG